MIVEAAGLRPGSDVRADVCVVGAGPAGLMLASRLADAGSSVVMLESGGIQPSVAAQQLNRGSLVGQATWPLHKSRFRTFGGSGTRWGGWCRPLDEADLLPTPGMADSGWPIDHATLVPYLRLAATELGLDGSATERLLARTSPAPESPPDGRAAVAMSDAGFEPITYEVSPLREDIGERFRDPMTHSEAIRVIVGATVTDIVLAPGSDRVAEVRVESDARTSFVVRATEFVLAAGGLENPRLLLASTSDRPAGLGNEHDLVGRYFMEHVHGPVGHLALGPRSSADPLFSSLAQDPATSTTLRALAATPSARSEQRLQAISIMAMPAPYGVWHPLIGLPPSLSVPADRLRRRLIVASARSADDVRLTPTERALITGYRRARVARSSRQLRRVRATVLGRGGRSTDLRTLYVRAEQAPHRDSRVRLSRVRDRFGLPQVELDWRVSLADTDSVERWIDRFRRATETLGDATVLPDPEWRSALEGGPHHMGTTRMSNDPRSGVVDEDCRVHSLANLHVAGSSVFTTGGYANPTLTLAALTLRLADHLAGRLAHRIDARGGTATAVEDAPRL